MHGSLYVAPSSALQTHAAQTLKANDEQLYVVHAGGGSVLPTEPIALAFSVAKKLVSVDPYRILERPLRCTTFFFFFMD